MSSRPQLHGLLRDSAQRDPARTVYIEDGVTKTYAELDTQSSSLAGALRELGVARGDRVALVLDRSFEYLIGYYGILKAGAAVVPLNPDTRARILAQALGHSGASAVITAAQTLRHVPPAEVVLAVRAVVVVGDASARVDAVRFDDLVAAGPTLDDAGAAGEDLAALQYTSGTTGPPKGAMLAHRNVVTNVRSIVEYLELTAEDRIAMVLPYFYVYGNSVLHTHVAAGGSIAAVGTMTFPPQVLAGIAEHRCTGLSGVPSTFARLVSLDNLGDHDLGSLRYVTQAGAAMSPALTRRLRDALPHARIFVMYGQTEASARLTYLPPEDLDRKVGSAGKAIPGVTLAVVDADGNEVAPGTVGELVARGDNIMLGYHQDPEATARALRPEGLRTGDVGSMDAEGFIFLVGRESDMIKSGGHRIGPLEIEEVVAELPGVHEVAAVGIPDELLGEAIALFVVPQQGTTLDEKQLLRACGRELPRYKLPRVIRIVDALPKTATGKLDRKSLRTAAP